MCVRVYVANGGAWTHEFTHATASKGLEGVRVCVRVYVTYGGAWTHEFTHVTASKGLEGVRMCVCVCMWHMGERGRMSSPMLQL